MWPGLSSVLATGEQTQAIRLLLPHVRQFVLVRHASAKARAGGMRAAALLDTRRIGMPLVDRDARIVDSNDRARETLNRGDGLTVRDDRLAAARPGKRSA